MAATKTPPQNPLKNNSSQRAKDTLREARLARLAHKDEAALKKALSGSPLASATHSGGPGWRLLQGDSLELLRSLPDRSIDLCFADPPYNLSNGGTTCQGGRRVSVHKGQWDESQGVEEDHVFHAAWLQEVQRVLKPSGTLFVSGTQHVIFNIGFAMQSMGYHFLNTITWYKPNAAPNLACRFLTHSSELIIWASPSRGKPLLHHFNYAELKEENGGKQMRDLWSIPTPGKREKLHGRHPTQKPLALLDRIIRSATRENALVLDPFNGSGTTGVAAVALGRRYLGLERESEYLDLSASRILEAAGHSQESSQDRLAG